MKKGGEELFGKSDVVQSYRRQRVAPSYVPYEVAGGEHY